MRNFLLRLGVLITWYAWIGGTFQLLHPSLMICVFLFPVTQR